MPEAPFARHREKAREAGGKGGKARAGRKLTLEHADTELPQLDGAEGIVRRL